MNSIAKLLGMYQSNSTSHTSNNLSTVIFPSSRSLNTPLSFTSYPQDGSIISTPSYTSLHAWLSLSYKAESPV